MYEVRYFDFNSGSVRAAQRSGEPARARGVAAGDAVELRRRDEPRAAAVDGVAGEHLGPARAGDDQRREHQRVPPCGRRDRQATRARRTRTRPTPCLPPPEPCPPVPPIHTPTPTATPTPAPSSADGDTTARRQPTVSPTPTPGRRRRRRRAPRPRRRPRTPPPTPEPPGPTPAPIVSPTATPDTHEPGQPLDPEETPGTVVVEGAQSDVRICKKVMTPRGRAVERVTQARRRDRALPHPRDQPRHRRGPQRASSATSCPKELTIVRVDRADRLSAAAARAPPSRSSAASGRAT